MIPVVDAMPPIMLIPASFLDSEFFQILATFVALNSLIYATLAVLKVVPKGYALFRFDGRNRRRQNRSIYPDSPQAPDVAGPSQAPTADGQAAPAPAGPRSAPTPSRHQSPVSQRAT